MICALASTRAWVLLVSGERFSVQLMNSASEVVVGGRCCGHGLPFGVGRAGRSSGVTAARRPADAQQGRAVGGEQLGHGRVELARGGRPGSRSRRTAGVLRPVRVVQRGLPHRAVAGPLLLADLAEAVVVEQHVLDRDAVLHRGRQLGDVLAEAAVAGDGDDRAAGCGGPRAERGRDSRSRSSRGSPTSAPAGPRTPGSGRASRRGCRRRR